MMTTITDVFSNGGTAAQKAAEIRSRRDHGLPTDPSVWSEEAALVALGPNPVVRPGVNHTATITRPCGHRGTVLLYWPNFPGPGLPDVAQPCPPNWMPALVSEARQALRNGDYALNEVYCVHCAGEAHRRRNQKTK